MVAGWDSSAVELTDSKRGCSQSSHSTSWIKLTLVQWGQCQAEELKRGKRSCWINLCRQNINPYIMILFAYFSVIRAVSFNTLYIVYPQFILPKLLILTCDCSCFWILMTTLMMMMWQQFGGGWPSRGRSGTVCHILNTALGGKWSSGQIYGIFHR